MSLFALRVLVFGHLHMRWSVDKLQFVEEAEVLRLFGKIKVCGVWRAKM